MYTLTNTLGLHLMQIDGNTKDYTFTTEYRLAMKFESREEARQQKYRLPINIRTRVTITNP